MDDTENHRVLRDCGFAVISWAGYLYAVVGEQSVMGIFWRKTNSMDAAKFRADELADLPSFGETLSNRASGMVLKRSGFKRVGGESAF